MRLLQFERQGRSGRLGDRDRQGRLDPGGRGLPEGRILSNGRGRALYLFTADHGKGSNCSGDCATAWPPYIVKSMPVAGPGAEQGLIGTTRRSDGRLQATYAGHPVYFYVSDNEPGEVLCQAVSEFGGYWYVMRANGKAVH
jgi:predicted lipoprotein with Yx(FWY)xxD motif